MVAGPPPTLQGRLVIMEVSRVRALRGPNLWSRQTAIEAIVACSESERAIGDMEAFETRLRARFPDIDLPRPPGLEGARSLAHILAVAALRLQTQAGCPVAFCRIAQTLEPGIYQVAIEYVEEAVGRLAFERALALCMATLRDEPFDLGPAIAELKSLYEDVRLRNPTLAPWRAKASAVALPIPDPAPVMRATFPANSMGNSIRWARSGLTHNA